MKTLLLTAALAFGLWIAFRPENGAAPSGAATVVTLADLAEDPAGWDGRQVTLSGRVIDRATMLGLGGVLIGDDAGNQLLATGWTGPITPGETATLTGAFHLALAVGNLELPVLLISPVRANDGSG